MTASELAGKSSGGGRTDPELFEQGMVVTHPDYGSGTIVALSGAGVKRMASVRFFGESTERRFRLAFSGLRPVGTPDDPISDDPVSDDPASVAPVSDEPVSDEPVSDDPVSDEPATDDAAAEAAGDS